VPHAGTIDCVARCEIVRAIQNDIAFPDQIVQLLLFQPLRKNVKVNVRIQRGKRGSSGLDFARAYRLGAVKNLALQVGEIDVFRIGDGEAAESARREIQRRGTAEAACADDQRARRPQPLLALDPDLGKEDVAAVAEKLLVVQLENEKGVRG
jgi:hypothetical protein